jgi:hypothetical protein
MNFNRSSISRKVTQWPPRKVVFEEFKFGGLHEKHAVAARKCGTIAAFA